MIVAYRWFQGRVFWLEGEVGEAPIGDFSPPSSLRLSVKQTALNFGLFAYQIRQPLNTRVLQRWTGPKVVGNYRRTDDTPLYVGSSFSFCILKSIFIVRRAVFGCLFTGPPSLRVILTISRVVPVTRKFFLGREGRSLINVWILLRRYFENCDCSIFIPKTEYF